MLLGVQYHYRSGKLVFKGNHVAPRISGSTKMLLLVREEMK